MPHPSRRLMFGLPSVLLFLAGCPAGVPTAPSSSPSTQPSSLPVASPTAGGPTSSIPPSSTPAPVQVETALVRGRVYDETGAQAPDGTTVRIRSLREGVPFETSVTTANGLYVVPEAPVDTQLEISATRAGWTTRKRVEVASRNPNKLESRNVFNFGGESDAADPQGRAFFISTYPEIESVEPLNASTSLAPDQMRVKLTLSEQLDEVNRRRLAAAIRVVPNSKAALAPNGVLPAATGAGELSGLFAGAEPASNAAYSYRQNSGFYNGLAQGGVTWSNDNRTLEFSLKAPVKTGTSDEAQYALILIQPDVDPIVDVEGNPLGMDAAGNFGGVVRNQLIRSALPMETPSFSGPASNNKERWRETHKSLITFSYAKDQAKPKLASVIARRNYSDGAGGAYDRVELTFSEPMITYPAIVGDQVLSLNNYRIASAPTEGELANAISSTSTASLVGSGSLVADIRAALKKSSGMAIDSDGATLEGAEGRFEVSLDPRDPKMVVLHLPAGALPLDANYVKVAVRPDERAASGSGNGVSDPAGNPMDPQADAQLGSIN